MTSIEKRLKGFNAGYKGIWWFCLFGILMIVQLPSSTLAQEVAHTRKIVHTLYLIGDAGEPDIVDQPLGHVLRREVQQSGKNTTLLYLGDNIYPKGMPNEGTRTRATAEQIINAQVSWIQGLEAKGIFVPGNHDWQRGNRKGFEYIQNQQQWVDSLKDKNITLLPRDGCAGPVEIPLSDKAVLVIIDTQWFLHPWDKPGRESDCEIKTRSDALVILKDVFARNYDKRVILAAHHPMISHGEHGGTFLLKDHIFPLTVIKPKLYIPLPVVGSIYPVYRKWFGNIQDIAHPIYKQMSTGIQEIMAEHPGSIFAAGHEHALQYLEKDSSHFIVSGSGSKTTYVKMKKHSRFAASVTGFVKLNIYDDGAAEVVFWEVDKMFPEGKIVFADSLPLTRRLEQKPVAAPPDYMGKMMRAHASDQYRAGKTKEKILGTNYRDVWAQEIDVPLLDLGTEKGGMKILKKGGGMQTLSLRLQDSTGHEYVLRSVEKFPAKAIPSMLRKTFAEDLVQDQMSAAHPYAALVIAPLAEAAGIYHANPKLVYIPDDPRLGIYRKDFANTLSIFEERADGNWSDAPFFGNSSNIINTSKVIERLSKDSHNQVDEAFVLRSRLFDLWIADWDRHDDQWRWASFHGTKSNVYRPIPRDRDQAFFVNEGLLPKFWSRKWSMPRFEGFNDAIRWPSGLAYNARYFDRSFLTELSRSDWEKIAIDLQSALTDDVIEKAIKGWPDEIYKLHGEEVIRKLKSRQKTLVTDALEHYEFLAKEVDVVGSAKAESFTIDRLPNGDVHVTVIKVDKDGARRYQSFDRLFKKGETNEIRVYAREGNDNVSITGTADRSIKVRVIGGPGVDSLVDNSHVKSLKKSTLYYDVLGENVLIQKGEVADRQEANPDVNVYDRRAFKYDRLSPLAMLSFNPDDGVIVGAGMLYQKQGFRDALYKQRHMALFNYATATSSFNFLYRGNFTDVIGRWGIEIDADVKAPNYVSNFFGIGNESKFDRHIDEKPGHDDLDLPIDYYRFQFDDIKFETFVTRAIGNWATLKAGPAFQRVDIDNSSGKDKYVNEFSQDVPVREVFGSKSYAGASWKFTIDERNSETLTTRGVVLNLSGRHMGGIENFAHNFSSYESSVSFYHGFRIPTNVVFAARIGAGHTTGNYDFYQAQTLGGKSEIRGYRKTRFYGDSKFYTNLEMRVKLFSLRTYLFPASFGLLGFHDFGRVWYKDANGGDPTVEGGGHSRQWHRGWGGGIWFTPFNITVLSIEAANSDEGTLAYLRLGFMF